MENTKLSLVKWFLALYFVATNKDGISEMALAKYIGGTLKTAWALLHKIRSAMDERENTYKLGDCVEMDDAFFGGKAASSGLYTTITASERTTVIPSEIKLQTGVEN